MHVVGRGEGAIVASEFAYAEPSRSLSLVMIGVGMRHSPPRRRHEALNWALLNLPIEGAS